MAPSKGLLGFILVVLLIPIGFVVGVFVGGFLVPEGSGLAGGAIVFGYGVVGAAMALVLGIVLAVKLPRPHLVRATWVALGGVFVAAMLLFLRYQSVQKGREADPVEQPALKPTGPAAPDLSVIR